MKMILININTTLREKTKKTNFITRGSILCASISKLKAMVEYLSSVLKQRFSIFRLIHFLYLVYKAM